jgi:putative SOS response-associated peptidase YedK
MCGRYELNETPARLGSRYRIDAGDLGFAPNADVRPTDTNPVILLADGQRIASMRHWGFVPSWAKDPKAISNPFNARSEEAYAKPFFRGPFRQQRCLVPASAFFEWKGWRARSARRSIASRVRMGTWSRSRGRTIVGTAAMTRSGFPPAYSAPLVIHPLQYEVTRHSGSWEQTVRPDDLASAGNPQTARLAPLRTAEIDPQPTVVTGRY